MVAVTTRGRARAIFQTTIFDVLKEAEMPAPQLTIIFSASIEVSDENVAALMQTR
jgi:hypothetical protein